MKIVAISDTHSYHRKIEVPDADTLICCGDISYRGELSIIEDFSLWLKELPHKNKIVIFGNHELGMEKGPKRPRAIKFIEDAGAHYLENSSVVIDNIKFYGSPASPWFYNWEWNYFRGKEIAKIWRKIPDDTNVLITHGPPYGILDLVDDFSEADPHVGCKDLLERIKFLREIDAHFFGHLHLEGGKTVTVNNTKYVNAAVCTDQYKPINKPVVIEI